ncbi:TPA: hypothetical protein HA318_01220 [Candidatus Micrarchaeota archaeon]|nr:MAG: hypothetical protein AUJ65_03780 [Candidatus Micrarchaeota archaeon CG1_02_51_15]HII38608.1 hypothetical protein [Candidatus Micrarchaeota archaeon]
MEGKPAHEIEALIQKMTESAALQAQRSRTRMLKLNQDPEFTAANAERMRQLHKNPEFAAAHKERASKTMIELHARPGFTEAISERTRAIHQDPEFAARASERMRKQQKHPEFRRRLNEALNLFWARYREEKKKAFPPTKWEYGKPVPATEITPEDITTAHQTRSAIEKALSGLG